MKVGTKGGSHGCDFAKREMSELQVCKTKPLYPAAGSFLVVNEALPASQLGFRYLANVC